MRGDYSESHKTGYSLIEMAVVLLIIGLLASSTMSIYTTSITNTQYSDTKNRMKEALVALQRFYSANGHLPCPAQGNLTLSSPKYGIAIYSDGASTDTGCDTNNPLNISAITANHAANNRHSL